MSPRRCKPSRPRRARPGPPRRGTADGGDPDPSRSSRRAMRDARPVAAKRSHLLGDEMDHWANQRGRRSSPFSTNSPAAAVRRGNTRSSSISARWVCSGPSCLGLLGPSSSARADRERRAGREPTRPSRRRRVVVGFTTRSSRAGSPLHLVRCRAAGRPSSADAHRAAGRVEADAAVFAASMASRAGLALGIEVGWSRAIVQPESTSSAKPSRPRRRPRGQCRPVSGRRASRRASRPAPPGPRGSATGRGDGGC